METLVEAITSGSMPSDCELLLEEELSHQQRIESTAWQPHWLITGLPAPTASSEPAPPDGLSGDGGYGTPGASAGWSGASGSNERTGAGLDELRSPSAYAALRVMMSILLIVYLVIGVSDFARVINSASDLGELPMLDLVMRLLLNVLGALVLYGLGLAILDIADKAVRGDERSGTPIA